MVFNGMDMHPDKKKKKKRCFLEIITEKEKKNKNHICNRGTGQKRRRKAKTEISGFKVFG